MNEPEKKIRELPWKERRTAAASMEERIRRKEERDQTEEMVGDGERER